MLKNLGLKKKLMIIGCAMTIIPLLIVMACVTIQNRKVVSIAEKESLDLAYTDLDHIVESAYKLAESHQEVTQKNVNVALNVARDLLKKGGGISLSSTQESWNAVNQYTHAESRVDLPRMLVGDTWLGHSDSQGSRVAIVDEVQSLLNVTCTLFQRMNDAGDMLRVATNVLNANGSRAIGTYIPRNNPDGQTNPVIASVLEGKTFRGRAYVVNKWYITAYEPIFDAGQRVMGVLYVGIPQENVTSLRRAILNTRIGKNGYLSVIDSAGKYVISKGEEKDGKNVLDLEDAGGKAYIRERIDAARQLKDHEIGSQQYALRNSNTASVIKREARFVYFEPWDWIITAESDQAEFMKAAQYIRDIDQGSKTLLALVALVSLLVTVVAWFFTAKGIATPVIHVVQGLRDIAEGNLTRRLEINSHGELGDLARWFNRFGEKMQTMVHELAENAVVLKDAAGNLEGLSGNMSQVADETLSKTTGAVEASQGMSTRVGAVAATMREIDGTVNRVATSAEEMSATINEIAGNTEKARGITGQAVKQSTNASHQVGQLGEAAQEIGKVVETITEISEQVNLLALNATIEAARAGEAGRGFAVVANEIKELARQTAAATGEIKLKVEGIQNTTSGTVKEIEDINRIVNQVNEIVTGIATAIEEQSVTTNEIAGSVSQASTSIGEVSQLVSKNAAGAEQISEIFLSVNGSNKSISENSSQVRSSAEKLRQLSEQLNSTVGRFRI